MGRRIPVLCPCPHTAACPSQNPHRRFAQADAECDPADNVILFGGRHPALLTTTTAVAATITNSSNRRRRRRRRRRRSGSASSSLLCARQSPVQVQLLLRRHCSGCEKIRSLGAIARDLIFSGYLRNSDQQRRHPHGGRHAARPAPPAAAIGPGAPTAGLAAATRAAKSKNSAHRWPSMCERASRRRASKSSRKSRPPCPLPLFSLDSRAGLRPAVPCVAAACRGVADGALLGVRGLGSLPVVRTGGLWGNSRRYVARALPVSWRAKKLTRKHSLQSARESGSGALWRRVSQRERDRETAGAKPSAQPMPLVALSLAANV
jgi:hypothetical protein